ncbi:polysialyltransferase family glycosyltransferase [Leptolyngbya boryana CZ1]|uniref:Polysialyltransferase family glycosyltransferase n=1 Tax=Leptolyngbya boryana CZ1 TaxID=3060204 RepID=A0AA96WPZ6_LEPBY|nr:polysialyltransferase family glycosyltransferase [Leptolyngbya boryana]WNZ43996.1 polysialyltransferase family glycosyltransferase [Leptolyngbya boryana CZ1]
MKRIITCQGSTQLVSALAAWTCREPDFPGQDENYLVIYGLYAPNGQDQAFAAFIQKMAEVVCSWKHIVYLSPEEMQAIEQELETNSPRYIRQLIQAKVGTETADEIYLGRNWQFGNQLLLNAYASATKICYGDSIGVYFSETSSVVSPGKIQEVTEAIPLHRQVKQWIKVRRAQVRALLGLRTVLQTIEFDHGYFVLPEVFGEIPPMPTVKVSPKTTLAVLNQMKVLVDETAIPQFQSAIAGANVAILLTSNLSEAGRLSEDNELQAYRSFLQSQGISPNTVLVIKPHPRDDMAKIYALKEKLSDLFDKVLILIEPELFFLPFEIFFLAVFSDCSSQIKIFAVSSACLAFKVLFDLPSFIGFGEELTTQRFDPPHIAARLDHEALLNSVMARLTYLDAQA